MVLPEPLLNKMRYGILLTLFLFSCSQNDLNQELEAKEQIIPSTYLLKSSSAISIQNGLVILNGKKYSGYLFQLYPATNDTIFIEGYHNGLLSGIFRKWYPNKQLMEERIYKEGKKNGRQVAYWENGNKKFEFIARDDVYEGKMEEWNVEGKLFHLGNYVNGQEEGAQKMWYDNAKIRANYMIIKGRRYGLLGTKNCKNVSDSIFFVK